MIEIYTKNWDFWRFFDEKSGNLGFKNMISCTVIQRENHTHRRYKYLKKQKTQGVFLLKETPAVSVTMFVSSKWYFGDIKSGISKKS